MLDNVIDINYYAVDKARNSNFKHRPVGLGIMGFQDCLHKLRIPYASQEAVEFADRSMEMVAYCAYWASTELAEERGRYPTFKGSLWDRGILPQDTLTLLAEERGGYVEVDRSATLDWEPLRARIRQHGMRNSNCLAIAPTATIANIIGVSASHRADLPEPLREIEPVGRVHGGQRVPGARPEDARPVGRGDDRRPQVLRRQPGARSTASRPSCARLYATAFEVEPTWLVEARRGGRSGSTSRSRSTSTWRALRARSWTRPTSSPGCAA